MPSYALNARPPEAPDLEAEVRRVEEERRHADQQQPDQQQPDQQQPGQQQLQEEGDYWQLDQYFGEAEEDE